MHKWLKYGLERSGTNYLGDMMALNFEVEEVEHYLDGYWKHGVYVRPLGREYDTVVIAKNVYSWLFSIHHLFKLKFPSVERDFSRFLRAPVDVTIKLWPTEETRPLRYDNPVDMWNRRNGHWLDVELEERSKVLVKYEDLLGDHVAVLSHIEESFGLKRRSEEHINISEECGPEYIKKNPGGDFGRTRYYLDAQYMADYSTHDMNFVNDRLDPSVMERLGYTIAGLADSSGL